MVDLRSYVSDQIKNRWELKALFDPVVEKVMLLIEEQVRATEQEGLLVEVQYYLWKSLLLHLLIISDLLDHYARRWIREFSLPVQKSG